MTALHTREYRVFARALIAAREAAGLSQYDLADRLGVDQSFISKYEHCRRRLDVIEFLRILQAIGANAPQFVDRLEADLTLLSPPPDN